MKFKIPTLLFCLFFNLLTSLPASAMVTSEATLAGKSLERKNDSAEQKNTSTFDMGLGFMRFSSLKISESEIVKLVQEALSRTSGNLYVDTAAAYDDRKNEMLLGSVLKVLSDEEKGRIKVITKCGVKFDPKDPFQLSDQQIVDSLAESKKHLNRDPDVFLVHRLPAKYPNEGIVRVVRTLNKLKQEKKVGAIGLSEPHPEAFRVALSAGNLDALEISYSPFIRRADKNGILEQCIRRGIKVIAYGVGLRGLLREQTAQMNLEGDSASVIEQLKNILSPFTLTMGYLQADLVISNMKKVQAFLAQAKALSQDPNALAVAWTLAHGVIPLVETSNLSHLGANFEGQKLVENRETLEKLNDSELEGSPNPLALKTWDAY